MKKTLLFILFLCFQFIGAQEKSHLSIDQVEQEIAVYTKKKMDSYALSPKEILNIRAIMMDEISHHGGDFDEKMFEFALKERKIHKLRLKFFEEYKSKLLVYESSSITNRQICSDGGFEGGTPVAGYVFTRSNGGFTYLNPGDNTTLITRIPSGGLAAGFANFGISATLNDFNFSAALVSNGQDPNVPVLQRVLNGSRAIKINRSGNNGLMDVTTMTRVFTINEATFNYNYSLVMENPIAGHLNSQPFFMVRLYDMNNNILRQSSPSVANVNDCMFIDSGLPIQQNSPLLYSGWICDQINTSDLIGQQVRVEFIIADCRATGHFGTVYIDDICNTNCANPLSGSINLNAIPTITCPTTNQTICGTYTLPQQSILNSITLNIIQSGFVVGSISTPTTLTSSSFCFDVPLTAFGVNPNGNFEFQAVGNFTRICTAQGNFNLLPISDNSSNDTGPDVVITNCIDAVNDSFTTSTCTMGSFSILNNDTVYSNPATISNTIITQTSPVIPQLTLNSSTGLVTVNSGSAPGIYTLNYQICNANNPLHCDTASVEVFVNAPQLEAIPDDFSSHVINACVGGTTSTVFVNDVYCGIPVTSSSVSVTLQNNGGIVGAGINSNGIISVPLNTPVGNYTLTYQICLNSNPSVCDTATVIISVVSGALPIFDFITTICNGTDAPILPLISNNGISGTWSPSVIDTTLTGTYTFTPNGNCALPVTVTVTILEECGLFLEWGSDVSCQLADSEDPRIKIDSDIADGPCIRVCENSTIVYELTGDVSSISYTEWNITGGTFTSTATTCTIHWDTNATFSAIQAIVHLTDGSVLLVNRCIEKLNAPLALFGIMPDNTLTEVTVCENTEVAFDNLTTANNGHDDIYYNWNFGDGATSNAFEPTHVYTHSGVYEVTLTAFNGCSCIGKYSIKVIVERGITPIECPSVVCENDRTTYTIPKEYGESCEIKWEVLGGEIVDHNTNNTSIAVIWNHVDENGFGYVTVGSEPCFKCTTTVKVPVVQNQGTIKGVNLLCEKAQGLYALPQWPTTDFTWTLDDAGTGATLILTNQRNEIIIQAGLAGVIQLRCNYFNTLLGCGGTAVYEIKVTPSLHIDGNEIVCSNSTHNYSFTYDGSTISPVQWQITGPDGYSLTGTDSPFSITFPSTGIYSVSVTDPDYCMTELFQIQAIDNPQTPTAISGPLTVCPGIPVSYSCVVPNGATANWEVTNGTIIGSNTSSQVMVNFDPLATTPYEIKLSFLVDDCYSDVLTTIINRDTPIIAFNVVEPLVCGSSYATYSINAIDVDNYEWTIFPASAGSVQSGQNTNEVYILWNQTPQTNVEVTVTVRKCGKDYSDTTLVDIINAPAITISGPTEACTGTPVTFNFAFTGSGFTNVLWDFGDGTTATSTTSNAISHIYNEPILTSTTFTVTATVTGANGCLMPSIATHSVVVSPSPVVLLSPTVNLNLCDLANTPADYTYSVTMQGGFSSTDLIQWYDGSGPISGATSPTLDVSTLGVGTYYAVVTNVFLCTDTTSSFTVYNDCATGCVSSNTIDGVATNTGCDEITVDITSFTGSPTEVFISYPPSFSSNITSITPNQLVASGLNPGQYTVTLYAEYADGCFAKKHVSFIIPYKAGIKHNITCATSGGGYNVQLLDYSIYYPDTPPTSFEFTTNNGATWQTGTIVGGIAQLTANLAPGAYTIGIRIQGGSYPSCTYFEPLVLPNYPVATFTHDPFACQNNAMKFYADDTTAGLQYFWEFINDGSSNLQQNPVKTFTSTDPQLVTLTVTNKYGCSASFTTAVVVVSNDMNGELELNLEDACVGSSIDITYTNTGANTIQTLYWYYNQYTAVPFAVTHAPNLNLTVTQSGQYFVYAQNTNGCMEYGNIDPISVAFVPAPQSPLVKGPTTVCINNPINLTVPVNSTLVYEWTLNGNPMPTWNNFTAINYWPTAVGNYVFTVTASVITSGGTSACVSLPTTYVVTVLDTPNVPELIITQVQCDPYKVTVSVSNPQGGVSYYWSNGDTGTTAIVTHDGPLQVRAEANGCGVTAQMDLPVDLDALAWIFPDGCFSLCNKNEDGYIIGPLGEFEAWKWFENGSGVLSGSGNVSALTTLSAPNSYELYIHNGYCDATYGTASFTAVECTACDIRFEMGVPKCVKINGVYVYEVPMNFVNSIGVPVTITISAPNGEGYFTSSTHNLTNGSSSVTSYFYPMNGFTGGVVSFVVEGTSEKGECFTKFDLEFPNCDFAPRMSEVAVDVVLVAPNPTKDFATVLYEMQNKGAVTIEIADPMGRTIWNKTFDATSGKVVIDCSVYAAGYYPVLVKQNGVVVAHTKLIVQ